MLPEVEAYFAKLEEHDNFDVWAARARVDSEHPMTLWQPTMNKEEREAYYAAETARALGYQQIEHDRREMYEAGMDCLRGSDNPLVKWIGDNHAAWRSYPDHVRAVLKALPMTREQMDTFGQDQHWCSEYDRFYQQAENAGVLPDYDGTYSDVDVTVLVDEFAKWYGATGHTRRVWEQMIRKHIPTIMDNARQAEAKKLEELVNSQQQDAPADVLPVPVA